MKVMLMASGRGSRLKPWTDQTPKPLLQIAGKPMLHWHLLKLARAGYREVVMNTGWLGDQIEHYCGDGRRWSLRITYAQESREEGEQLEVGGGIVSALPLLGESPFLVINADIWTDWSYEEAGRSYEEAGRICCSHDDYLGMLLLSKDAAFPDRVGDFCCEGGRLLPITPGKEHYLFSGISVLSPLLFQSCAAGKVYFLFDILQPWIEQNRLRIVCHSSFWTDMGTPAAFHFLSNAWPGVGLL